MTTETAVDPLESLARLGAQRMLQSALEDEEEACLQRKRYERKDGATGYRSGYLPEHKITLGSGGVPIRAQAFSGLADQRLGCTSLQPARRLPHATIPKADIARDRVAGWIRACPPRTEA